MDDDIRDARTIWKQAYLDGDLPTLERIESDRFQVTTDCGPRSKTAQLSGIARAIAENRYFPPGSRYRDEAIDAHVVGDMALIRGLGQVLTPEGARPPISFTEVWQRIHDEWKVVHLHFARIAGADPLAEQLHGIRSDRL